MEVKTVSVYLYRGAAPDVEVLLLGRHAARGERWVAVGGKVEPGESWREAAAREVLEETGLDVDASLEPLGYRFSFERDGHSFTEETFAARGPERWDPVLDEREHDGHCWLSLDAAREATAWPENREALAVLARRLRRS